MKQTEALDVLKMGYNVFLTGAAGAGKTYVLNEFISHLRKHKIGVGVTASTGIAATHMNGMTIHSWAGIGINDEIDEDHLQRLLDKAPLKKRFNDTKVLIIDEVSMLHGVRLDLVDQVCRAFKNPDKPFGGLQVILSGDLFQLPPVTRDRGPVDWVFKSAAWRAMDLKICYLEEQHRQEDSQLLDILNAVRSGEVEEYHQELLSARLQVQPTEEDLPLTRLYTHNADVDEINQKALAEINSTAKTFLMTSSKGSKKLIETLMKSCLAPEILNLKVGTEVMFVSNNPAENYVNGTRGRVVAFTDENLPVIVTTDDRTIVAKQFAWRIMDGEKVRAEINQLPLRLAWAITVHKSQGMSLDSAEIDLSRAFEPGMGYVAVSRVRRLDGLFLKGVNSSALMIHPEIREFDMRLQTQSARLVDALTALDKDKLADSHKRVIVALAPELPIDPNYDELLLDEFKKWRFKLASEKSVPPYVIFDDKTIKLFASVMPEDEATMLKIKGVGPQKLEQYSADVFKIVANYKKIEQKSEAK